MPSKLLTFLKSNLLFIVALVLLLFVTFHSGLKVRVLRGLISMGWYEPDVSHLKLKPAALPEKEEGLPVPSVVLQSANGERLDLSDSKGKVIFLNFWATWCSPCIAEMPTINTLKDQLGQQGAVDFVMVDIDNQPDRSKAFMDRHHYQLPVYTLVSTVPKSLFRGTVPTTIIINKKGEIVFQHEGMADYQAQDMITFLRKLVNE